MTNLYQNPFTAKNRLLLERASILMEVTPLDNLQEVFGGLTIHEMVRAAGRVFGLPVQDGAYGRLEHSWLLAGPESRPESIILDLMMPGGFPPVQLVDTHPECFPVRYVSEENRTDTRNDVVGALEVVFRTAIKEALEENMWPLKTSDLE